MEELKWDGMHIGKSSGRLPGFLVPSKRKISAANTQVAEPILSSPPHWYRLEKVAAWNMNRRYLSMLNSLLIFFEASQVNHLQAINGPNAPHDSVDVVLYSLLGKC